MEGLRIGYLLPEFPTQTHIFFWREAEALRRMGVHLNLLSTRRPPAAACPHAFREEAVRETHYLLPPDVRAVARASAATPRALVEAARLLARLEPNGSPAKTLAAGLAAIAAGAELADVARRERLDHVHVHSCANAALIARFARLFGGPPYSLTLHNPLFVYGPNQREKWANAAFAIVITQKIREEVERDLAGSLPPRILVAPMGVNVDKFVRRVPYEAWTGAGALRVFSCGRLNPCKAHDDLIRATAALRAKGKDVELVIAGEDLDSGTGQYRRELEDLAKELGVREHVRFLGSVGEERVREELESAHVFALASLEEPLGVVIMEAMSMQLPLVATRAGGVTELVRDGTDGLLVDPRDPDGLATAIETIATSPERARAMGAAGRERVGTRFSSDVSARAILEAVRRPAFA